MEKSIEDSIRTNKEMVEKGSFKDEWALSGVKNIDDLEEGNEKTITINHDPKQLQLPENLNGNASIPEEVEVLDVAPLKMGKRKSSN